MNLGDWVCVVCVLIACCDVVWVSADPVVRATRGEVWPKPQAITTNSTYMAIRPKRFHFNVTGKTCMILEKALERYKQLITACAKDNKTVQDSENSTESNSLNGTFNGFLDSLEVKLDSECEEYPHLEMDELYSLTINYGSLDGKGVLHSVSIWGILRGLETFSQLLTTSTHKKHALVVNSTMITDYPRFPHRGLLLDTSRHFEPLSTIYTILDGMESNKLNVFHWHIVDDQSFPYQSKRFPALSKKGAYDPKYLIYTIEDIENVIEYARLRGIRVMPEFDTPGHTLSWGKGIPKLLTPCYHWGQPSGEYGPIDPSRQTNYKFVKELFNEVTTVFKDKYIHLGGDEVSFTCWASNPQINSFMKNNSITTYEGLESFYIQKVLDFVTDMNASAIVWQEVFQNNVKINNDTVVQLWLGSLPPLLKKVTSSGHKALVSQCWYLDHLDQSWIDFYYCDPWSFDGTEAEKKLVIGGEACMWGEMVDESNVVSRIFPRASATAEKLWSSVQYNLNEVKERLEEHYCRMKKRGIPSQPPTGPGYCL